MGIKESLNLTRVPSILLLGMVYVAYVLIGGVIFWKLEGDLGKKDISNILQNKQSLLSTYTCLNQKGLEDVAQVRPRNTKPDEEQLKILFTGLWEPGLVGD